MTPSLLKAYARANNLPSPEAAREAITAILDEVSKQARSFAFGPHTREDLAQQAYLYALEALPRYDVSRPLLNFLARHVKNRLHNLKRDTYLRPEAPCKCCDPFCPPPEPCAAWRRWEKRNRAKLMLANAAAGEDQTFDWNTANRTAADDQDQIREVDAWADANLSPDLRADYLRMKQGAKLPRARREAVLSRLRGAFADEG